MSDIKSAFADADIQRQPSMAEIFANISPTEANDLFSIREMHDIALTCVHRAKTEVDSPDYKPSTLKAGRLASLAYETVKHMRAVKQARLAAAQ